MMSIRWPDRSPWIFLVLCPYWIALLIFTVDSEAIAQSSDTLQALDSTANRRSSSDTSTPSVLTSIDPSDYDEYPDFARLQLTLEQANFVVKLELPPKRGNYGLLEIDTRTIWINPVVFELGIAQHTLVHEAVHAAQLCGSHEELAPLALGLEPPLVVQPYFMRYNGLRRLIEAEAYTVQALDNSVDYVIDLLNAHCQ